ncbi:response regulator transcription factor, partial [Mesorhizobium sp. M3A.F.Ca.ET.174.01.1.1]
MNSESNILAESASRAPLRVLLIEDSPLIRRSLVEAIDASGSLRVAAYADSADEAIALLGDEAFDAVIVDLQLKRGSGVPVLAYLQREGLIDSVFA